MTMNVLPAGHFQAKYFDEHIEEAWINVFSFSGYQIEEMCEEVCFEVPLYKVVVFPNGTIDLWNDSTYSP